MNKITSILFLFLLIFSLNSCCTKKDCEGEGDIYKIEFCHFEKDELDSIIIIRYQQNSSFLQKIDSSTYIATFSNNTYFINFSKKLDLNFDYKIKPIDNNFIFELNNFIMEKHACNSCFPKTPESDYFYVLKNYSINGVVKSGNEIKIYK